MPSESGIFDSCVIFYFSSRRRHTRWPRDWSSDVCSSDLIGGQFQHRDHRGDPNARRPFEPVPREKQVEALNTIIDYAFSSDALEISEEVYQQFGANRWNHWGMSNTWKGRIDYPIHQTLLGVQTSLLNQLFHPVRLERIRDTELKFGIENTVTIPELVEKVTEATWEEVWDSEARSISSNRRDLQRAHLDLMIRILRNPPAGTPSDARSVVRSEERRVGKEGGGRSGS